MMISLPMPMDASVIGEISMPASPANVAPSANTPANRVLMSMPSAPTIVRFEAPARDEHAEPGMADENIEAHRDEQSGGYDQESEGWENGIAGQRHLTVKPARQRHGNTLRPPDQLHERVETQNQTEGRQNMIEMIARIEMTDDGKFDQDAGNRRRRQGE